VTLSRFAPTQRAGVGVSFEESRGLMQRRVLVVLLSASCVSHFRAFLASQRDNWAERQLATAAALLLQRNWRIRVLLRNRILFTRKMRVFGWRFKMLISTQRKRRAQGTLLRFLRASLRLTTQGEGDGPESLSDRWERLRPGAGQRLFRRAMSRIVHCVGELQRQFRNRRLITAARVHALGLLWDREEKRIRLEISRKRAAGGGSPRGSPRNMTVVAAPPGGQSPRQQSPRRTVAGGRAGGRGGGGRRTVAGGRAGGRGAQGGLEAEESVPEDLQAMAAAFEKRKVMLNSITTKMENDVELVEQVSVWSFERRCCCLRSCTVAYLTDIVLRPPGNRTRRSSCPR
jgi:hypothetical protein